MPITVAYLLEFRGPLRVGGRGFQREALAHTLHSDVLFSALVWAVRRLWGFQAASAWVAPFTSAAPPFLLSSAAPFVRRVDDGRPVLLFPRPVAWHGQGDGKAWRRASWVSEQALHRPQEVLAVEDGALVTQEEAYRLPPGPWWRESLVARVALDRLSQASNLYFVRHRYFRPGCGLWFVAHYLDEGWRSRLEAALKALGDEGIGGERSRGAGRFRIADTVPGPPPAPDSASPCLNLALWFPREEEFSLLARSQYLLLERSGWVCSPDIPQAVRNLRVQMVREGAVLPRGGILGRMVDVTPPLLRQAGAPHPVYRYGYAYPVHMGEG